MADVLGKYDEAIWKYRRFQDEDIVKAMAREDLDSELKCLYEELREMAREIETRPVFNSEAIIDAVPTEKMKYLLVPYMMGLTAFGIQKKDERCENVQNAIICCHSFLKRMERLQVVNDSLCVIDSDDDLAVKRQKKEEATRLRKELEDEIKARFPIENKGLPELEPEEERELLLQLLKEAILASEENSNLAKLELPFLERYQLKKDNIYSPNSTHRGKPSKPFILRINNPSELRTLYLDKVMKTQTA